MCKETIKKLTYGRSLPQSVFVARGRGQGRRCKKGGSLASYLNGLRRFWAEVEAVKKVEGVSAETLWVVMTSQ